MKLLGLWMILCSWMCLLCGCGKESIPAAGIPQQNFDAAVAAYNRGIGSMERYQPNQAVAAFQSVVELAPGWIPGRLNLGIALLNQQKKEVFADAEQELRWVIEVDADNLYALYSLAMLLRHLNQVEEATALFERVVALDEEDADAHYQLGILALRSDQATARAHLERTLALAPHHESATYRLATLYRNAGESQQALALLDRFRALKSAKAGQVAGMKYGEMGRYANVLRVFAETTAQDSPAPVSFQDRAAETGLVHAAAGRPGWPGGVEETPTADLPAFGPGVALADIDGDLDLDLYLPGMGAQGAGVLYRNEGGRFEVMNDHGIRGEGAIGAWFGDYDKDGDPDLFLSCRGSNRLYRNDGGFMFTDVTATAGVAGEAVISVGCAWADADHDGDLDLYVANFGPVSPEATAGAANVLWRNNGDGTFAASEDQTVDLSGGAKASLSVLFFDVDADRDLDLYLIHHHARNQIFLNDRAGVYRHGSEQYPQLCDRGASGAVLADLDGNGLEDLMLLHGPLPPRLMRQSARGRYQEDLQWLDALPGCDGAASVAVGDYDLDGDLDLVLLDARIGQELGHRLLVNDGVGGFRSGGELGAPNDQVRARGAAAADFDQDGGLDILLATADSTPELWQAPPAANAQWLQVLPTRKGEQDPVWAAAGSPGLLVEVKTHNHTQIRRLTPSGGYLSSPPRRAHFGLRGRSKADYVRLTWPDAVLQSEMEVAAAQLWRVQKVARKPSSCPILFTWDGERFAFVTDFLGVGGLGFFQSPGVYAPPDPTEDVRIPPQLIQPRDGNYLLRITEPLEEVTYLDQMYLKVYQHPQEVELYPDERFTGTPPFPDGRALTVAQKHLPIAAQDEQGLDQLDAVLAIDRHYVEPPIDPRFVGFARDHWLELDFGDTLASIDPQRPLFLFLHGWVEYTYSHVNFAAWQAGLSMQPPRIEVPDGNGGWRTAIAEAGFPAGLPRMMSVDVSALGLQHDGRLRIRSNMEVFWDQAFVATDLGKAQVGMHLLQAHAATLRPLGYPREYSPDGANPTVYDYHRLDQGVPFKIMSGSFTPYGDVRDLLGEVDDRFVIMARGEEIALEFSTLGLPPLPEGWARTVVLHADGYCKDMDLYTAFPDTVEPMPFHGMENYPPTEGDHSSATGGTAPPSAPSGATRVLRSHADQ